MSNGENILLILMELLKYLKKWNFRAHASVRKCLMLIFQKILLYYHFFSLNSIRTRVKRVHQI